MLVQFYLYKGITVMIILSAENDYCFQSCLCLLCMFDTT